MSKTNISPNDRIQLCLRCPFDNFVYKFIHNVLIYIKLIHKINVTVQIKITVFRSIGLYSMMQNSPFVPLLLTLLILMSNGTS